MNGYLLKPVKKQRFILLRDKDIKEMLNKAWTLAWPVVIEQALATLSQVDFSFHFSY